MKIWKILVLTPYIIMLAVSMSLSASFSHIAYEFLIVILYTIILVIALFVRWIIVRR